MNGVAENVATSMQVIGLWKQSQSRDWRRNIDLTETEVQTTYDSTNGSEELLHRISYDGWWHDVAGETSKLGMIVVIHDWFAELMMRDKPEGRDPWSETFLVGGGYAAAKT